MLVQDGLAPMRGERWRTCPALFKTGMCEMKILGSEVSCFFYMYFCDVGFRMGWHQCAVKDGELVRHCSKRGCVR